MISPRPTLPPTTPSSATTLTPAMRGLSADDEADHLRECRRALGEMRDLAAEAFRARQSETCAFYADKALSTALALHSLVSARSPTAEEAGPADIGEDVILLAKAHHDMGSHMRAVHLLEQHRLLNISDRRGIEACTLASQCLLKGGKRSECLLLLDQVLGEGETGIGAVRTAAEKMALAGEGKGVNPVAALCAIRGAALATSDLSERARVWLKTALSLDNRCVYALQVLLENHLLSEAEQLELVESLHLAESQRNWLALLYKSQLDGLGTAKQLRDDTFLELDALGFNRNLSVLTAKAKHFYEQNDARTAFDLCHAIQAADPHATCCLPVYIASMVQLEMKSQLYRLAHSLVEANPKRAISWYAVGCYYLLTGKHAVAQVYFIKSTNCDSKFLPALVGLGNSFSACEEVGPAESAYRTAARLFSGSHVPLLYIAMECLKTQGYTLADHFLADVSRMAPLDPLVLNETGVAEYYKGHFKRASEYFYAVVERVKGLPMQLLTSWVASFVNLGHCYRKMRRYSEAIAVYQKAIALDASDAQTHASLGFALHMRGDFDAAIDVYHCALSLQPCDSLIMEMLDRALEDALGTYVNAVDADLNRMHIKSGHPTDSQGAAPETVMKSRHDRNDSSQFASPSAVFRDGASRHSLGQSFEMSMGLDDSFE